MTALVYLEDNPDLNRRVTVERSDVFAASTTYLKANDQHHRVELLHLLLIPSDNGAARALARTSHGGTRGVRRADEREGDRARAARARRFADPSGLNANNVSSAFDLSHLITFAASDERIASIMRTPTYTVATNRRMIPIHSTNHIVHERRRRRDGREDRLHQQVRLLPGHAAAPARQGNPVAVVVLGATRTTAASGRRATSSTGSTRRRASCSRIRHRNRLQASAATSS